MLDYIVIGITIVMLIFVVAVFCIYLHKQLSEVSSSSVLYPLIFIFIAVAAAYGCLVLTEHYSVDSLNVLFDTGAYWQLQLGRYLTCGLFLIADKTNIDPVLSQNLFAILWCLFLCMSAFIIWSTFQNIFKSPKGFKLFLLAGISLIAFTNVFMMEFVLFPEVLLASSFGVLSLALSIYFALNSFGCKKNRIISFFLLIVSLGNYQSYVGVFEAFVLCGIYLSNKNKCFRIKQYLYALIMGGAASIFNVLLVKLLVHFDVIADSGRGASLSIFAIIDNLKGIAKYQKNFWSNADGLIFGVWMPFLGLSLFCLLVVALIKAQDKIELLLLLVASYLLCFAPHIIEAEQLLTPRSNLAIWSFISSACFLLVSALGKSKQCLNIIACNVFVLLFVSIISMNDIATNTRAMNCVDFIEAQQICADIKRQEIASGVQIQKIAVCYDKNPTIYQSFSKYKTGELGARILVVDYSGYRLINYTLGRSLEKIQMPNEIYNTYFSGKDWDALVLSEQAKYVDDTVYLAIY